MAMELVITYTDILYFQFIVLCFMLSFFILCCYNFYICFNNVIKLSLIYNIFWQFLYDRFMEKLLADKTFVSDLQIQLLIMILFGIFGYMANDPEDERKKKLKQLRMLRSSILLWTSYPRKGDPIYGWIHVRDDITIEQLDNLINLINSLEIFSNNVVVDGGVKKEDFEDRVRHNAVVRDILLEKRKNLVLKQLIVPLDLIIANADHSNYKPILPLTRLDPELNDPQILTSIVKGYVGDKDIEKRVLAHLCNFFTGDPSIVTAEHLLDPVGSYKRGCRFALKGYIKNFLTK